MLDLANDSRTLSMMGEPTFRQKGEAFLAQLRRHYVPAYFRWMAQQQANIHHGQIGYGWYQQGQAQDAGFLTELIGGVIGGGLPH